MRTPFSATLVFAAAIVATVASAGAFGDPVNPDAMSDAAFQHLIAGARIIEDEGPQLAASDIAEIDRRHD